MNKDQLYFSMKVLNPFDVFEEFMIVIKNSLNQISDVQKGVLVQSNTIMKYMKQCKRLHEHSISFWKQRQELFILKHNQKCFHVQMPFVV